MSEKNTNRNHRFVTAEAVRAGHPDKFCDQLADRLQGDTNNLLTLTLAFPGEGPPQTP